MAKLVTVRKRYSAVLCCAVWVLLLLTSNTADLKTGTNLRRQLALSPAQHNVQELLLSGHRGDILPSRLHDGRSGDSSSFLFIGRKFKATQKKES